MKPEDIWYFIKYLPALRRFAGRPVDKNTILLIEANTCHGEVLPAYANYLLELGFNVDLMLTPQQAKLNPLARIKNSRIYPVVLPRSLIAKLMENDDKLGKYHTIFFTSQIIYAKINGREPVTIFDNFPNLKKYIHKLVAVEHQFEIKNDLLASLNKSIVLADYLRDSAMVNPHYFGEIKINPKNEKTIFISVGATRSERRNAKLLVDAVGKLHEEKISNFQIIIIGRSRLGIPRKLKQYFSFRGFVDYPKMYETIEMSDFFISLLDPENLDHDHYITTRTSGSFQLVYGFRKPTIIAEKFARKHKLDCGNSIIYNKNSELADAMKTAIEMSREDYEKMRNILNKHVEDIYLKSLENLKKISGG